MPAGYSPIIRTFCQLRAGLVNSLGVARHEVHPGTPLDGSFLSVCGGKSGRSSDAKGFGSRPSRTRSETVGASPGWWWA